MAGDEAGVRYEPDGRVAYLTLNNPEKLNALSNRVLSDFDRALEALAADRDVRVGIIRGEGRAFCAGYDLTPSGPTVQRRVGVVDDREGLQQTIERWLRIWDCPKPVIAQIHGYCLAGGTQIPIFCDLAVVAEDAVLGWPKLPLGGGYISPMWAWSIGPKRAKQMSFIAGSTMTGREAYEWGYANICVPASELAGRTRALADEIAKMPSELLRVKKLAINRVMEIQGFRTSVMFGAEWDSILHEAESVAEMRRSIRELGLRGAIAKYEQSDE
jgi:enoyl-CoA hydratase